MPRPEPPAIFSPDSGILAGFLGLAGTQRWDTRLAELGRRAASASLSGRAAQRRHALELTLHRMSNPKALAGATAAERQVLSHAQEAVRLARELPPGPRERLRERLLAGLTGEANLIPLFHLLRVAAMQRARGFTVHFTGLAEETPYDLLIERDGVEAEVACETFSAEEGRPVLRGDWCALVDAINPDLQTWLAAHPGRYVLKMTLPEGLKRDALKPDALDVPALHRRILDMLQAQRRRDSAADAVLKLDPLVLAGAQVAIPAATLRAQFGPEAHLAVTQGGGNILVLAARAGQESEIAQAACRRMVVASERLGGLRPGLLAVFLEDLDSTEWRGLRDRRELEGAVRRFLTTAAAQRVVAVSCTSRMELFGMTPPDSVEGGELRFRNPSHAAAKVAALLPAIASSP
jgi:hypothetical protein